MALPLIATVEQLQARMEQTYTGTELTRAGAVLGAASTLVRWHSGKDWVDASNVSIAPPIAVEITLQAAERAMRNPDGLSMEQVPEYTWRKENAGDGVFLTPSEERILKRLGGRSGLWTQPTTKLDNDISTVYYYDQFGTEPFPLEAAQDFPWGWQ